MKLLNNKTIGCAVTLLIASTALCQTSLNETNTLQSLLTEVHQLRLDIEAMTVASQRVQIVLYQLQIQDAAVGRAAQRLDNTHNRCVGVEGSRQRLTADIARFQNVLDSGTLQENQVKDIQSNVTNLKTNLESQTAEAQACQLTEAEASGQLQREQSKLTELQDRIERLDDSLKKVSGTQ